MITIPEHRGGTMRNFQNKAMDDFYIDGEALNIIYENGGSVTRQNFAEYCGDEKKANHLIGDLVSMALVKEIPPRKSVMHLDGLTMEMNNERRYTLSDFGRTLLEYYLMEKTDVV